MSEKDNKKAPFRKTRPRAGQDSIIADFPRNGIQILPGAIPAIDIRLFAGKLVQEHLTRNCPGLGLGRGGSGIVPARLLL